MAPAHRDVVAVQAGGAVALADVAGVEDGRPAEDTCASPGTQTQHTTLAVLNELVS